MSQQLGVDRDYVGQLVELNKDSLIGRFRCTNGFEFTFTGRPEIDRADLIAMFAKPGTVTIGAQAVIPTDEDRSAIETTIQKSNCCEMCQGSGWVFNR